LKIFFNKITNHAGVRETSNSAAAKYSNLGNPKVLNILKGSIQGANRGLLEASQATNSWNKHCSAMNSIEKFCKSHSIATDLPFTLDVLCMYVSWALLTARLKPNTVKAYLVSINTVHKLSNLPSHVDNYVVQSLITGAENLNMYQKIVVGTRKVMTLQLLKIIGHQIAKENWSENSKAVIWGACVTAFFGSFRFGELLSDSPFNFNPNETLLWKDVQFQQDGSILIHIKMDKNRLPQGSYIDLFTFSGHNCCPIAVLKKLKTFCANPEKPIFQFENGKMLTSRYLNDTVQKLLYPIIGEPATLISGHSFRAALPSAMANDPLAIKDIEIKNWGRWSSESYLLYTRLKLKQKKSLFEKITSVLNRS
jgi:hypothetical protein